MGKKDDNIDPLQAAVIAVVFVFVGILIGVNQLTDESPYAVTITLAIMVALVIILVYVFRYQIKQHLGLAARSYGLNAHVNDKTKLQQSDKELEAQLSFKVANNLNRIEAGMELVGIEHPTDVGRIDILARDKSGRYVVIELKRGTAGDKAIGQVTRYMGAISEKYNQKPRGLIIARDFNQQMKTSAKMIPDLDLLRYDQIKL